MKPIIWSISDVIKILTTRQENEFDGNIIVSGQRGDGKSSLIVKILYRLKNYNPWKHQVYSRADVIKLLQTQEKGLCFDDEAINSGYKRDFQSKAQQELIKIITAYRDNFNIYASAIPNFFSLDKDLRDLCFLHLHVVERGMVVVHMPLQGLLYSQDRWDTKNNARVEERWTKKIKKNPNFKPQYHKLSTFKGYLYFEDITTKQKQLYKKIKREKRKTAFKEEVKEKTWIEKLYDAVIEKKLSRQGLLEACLTENKKYNSVKLTLNNMIRDAGKSGTLKDYWRVVKNDPFHTKLQDQITNLIPDL